MKKIILIDDNKNDLTWVGIIIGAIVGVVFLLTLLFKAIEGAADTISMIFRLYVPLVVSFVFFLICLIGRERGILFRVLGLVECVLTCLMLWLFFRIVFCDEGGFLRAIERYTSSNEFIYMGGIRYVVWFLLILAAYLQYFLPVILLTVIYLVFNRLSDSFAMCSTERFNYGFFYTFSILCMLGMVFSIWFLRPAYTFAHKASEGFWRAILGLVLFTPVFLVCRKLLRQD